MTSETLTIGQFVTAAAEWLEDNDNELTYNRADLDGFIRAAWPVDGEPAELAKQFAGELAKQRCKARVVFTATAEWLEIAEKQGLEVNWESEFDYSRIEDMARLANVSACECDFRPNDSELGAAELIDPRDCDTALRAGDVVLTSGPGGDVAFLRFEE